MIKSYSYLCNAFKKWSSTFEAETINSFGFSNMEDLFEWAYNNFDNEKEIYYFLSWCMLNNYNNKNDYDTLRLIFNVIYKEEMEG